jgi:hypothetical protein
VPFRRAGAIALQESRQQSLQAVAETMKGLPVWHSTAITKVAVEKSGLIGPIAAQ